MAVLLHSIVTWCILPEVSQRLDFLCIVKSHCAYYRAAVQRTNVMQAAFVV